MMGLFNQGHELLNRSLKLDDLKTSEKKVGFLF
jgi:hypothetical protein